EPHLQRRASEATGTFSTSVSMRAARSSVSASRLAFCSARVTGSFGKGGGTFTALRFSLFLPCRRRSSAARRSSRALATLRCHEHHDFPSAVVIVVDRWSHQQFRSRYDGPVDLGPEVIESPLLSVS